ncbi:hypothetical protein ABIB80_005386 [Bradyrhizobium sp. i1.15.2]|uniref:twin-arginine translocation pathway signal n=1 Tax=Bradyrhizobium sp. i1.15.2 TaxID=3156362 RepID=UPI00339175CC
MAALIRYRLRTCCVAVALLAAGFALSGCAGISETVAPAFADPARYELYDCKLLEAERKGLANRTADLQRLMDKAQTGAGGAVVSELAYRNDYVAVRGRAQMADDAWRRNKCRETPPEATPAAALAPAANPLGPIKPAPKSTRAVR